MSWLFDFLAWWLGSGLGERAAVRKRHRDAIEHGRFVAMRESRLAKWVDGEITVTPTRIEFRWSHSTRSEPYGVVGAAQEGAGPRVLDGDTEILGIDTGTGSIRFAVLRRDLDQVLLLLERDGSA